jgi:hypothetical protein
LEWNCRGGNSGDNIDVLLAGVVVETVVVVEVVILSVVLAVMANI